MRLNTNNFYNLAKYFQKWYNSSKWRSMNNVNLLDVEIKNGNSVKTRHKARLNFTGKTIDFETINMIFKDFSYNNETYYIRFNNSFFIDGTIQIYFEALVYKWLKNG